MKGEGTAADGDPVPARDEPPAVLARSVPVGAALRSRAFWWLTASFWLKTIATATIIVHLIPYLTERGYAASFAATVAASDDEAPAPDATDCTT